MTSKEEADKVFAEFRAKIFKVFETEFHARPDVCCGGKAQIAFSTVCAGALLDLAAEIGLDLGLTPATLKAILDESCSRPQLVWGQ